MKNILFYGDSNTWGSDVVKGGRLDYKYRYTTLLQKKFSDVTINVNGLCGRSTAFDDSLGLCVNGYVGLDYALMACAPLDLVLFMLGTNDLKPHTCTDARLSAKGIELLIEKTQSFKFFQETPPKILVISPVHITKDVLDSQCSVHFNENSCEESEKLAYYYKQVCDNYKCEFLDASLYAAPSTVDGVHIDEVGHKNLANALCNPIHELLYGILN